MRFEHNSSPGGQLLDNDLTWSHVIEFKFALVRSLPQTAIIYLSGTAEGPLNVRDGGKEKRTNRKKVCMALTRASRDPSGFHDNAVMV